MLQGDKWYLPSVPEPTAAATSATFETPARPLHGTCTAGPAGFPAYGFSFLASVPLPPSVPLPTSIPDPLPSGSPLPNPRLETRKDRKSEKAEKIDGCYSPIPSPISCVHKEQVK